MTDILLVTFFAGNEIDHPGFFAVEMGYYRECSTRDGARKFGASINESADDTFFGRTFCKTRGMRGGRVIFVHNGYRQCRP